MLHLKIKHNHIHLNYTVMKSKKTEKSNLEKKTTLFFQMGIVIVMAGMLVAFESGTSSLENTFAIIDSGLTEEIDITQITRPEIEKPKPPVVPVEIIIIDDPTIDIDEPDNIWSIEDDPTIGLIPIEFDEEEVKDDIPFIKVEKMPSYMGGDETKFQKHLQQLVIYPTQAIELGIGGRVLVNFVIDKNGNLTQPTIYRSPDILLSNAVLSAIEKTKKWKPGEQRNIKVPVQFTIPINFQLQ